MATVAGDDLSRVVAARLAPGLIEARHKYVDARQCGGDVRERSTGAASLHYDLTARLPEHAHRLGELRLERGQQSHVAEHGIPAPGENCGMAAQECDVEQACRSDVVRETPLTAGVDERGGRAGGRPGPRLNRGGANTCGGEPRSDLTGPEVFSHNGGSLHARPEPPQRHAGVTDDAARRHLERIDMEEPPPPDRSLQGHRSHEDVGHTRAADG